MVHLRPIRDDELPAWIADARRFYVVDLEANSGLTAEEAEAKAGRDHASLFPDGKPLEGHHLFVVEDDAGEAIGRLWYAERPFGVWLYEIDLHESVRGRGHGRAAMLELERLAREHGVGKIALNVFGGNERARGLYRSLGYAEESVQMAKRL